MAAPAPSRPPAEEEWRIEYARLHAVTEEAKHAAASQQRAAAIQQEAAAAAKQETSRPAAELARIRDQVTQAQTATALAPTAAAAQLPAQSVPPAELQVSISSAANSRKPSKSPIFEGKLDLQLVAGYIRKVELMATNLE